MKITSIINYNLAGGSIIQYLAAITGTLPIIISGMHYGWPAPSLPKLENMENNSTLSISGDMGSWMAVMPLISGILGSLTVASMVDTLGRKWMIILTSFPYFIAWIMIAFAKTSLLITIARFIAGIADGWAFSSVPIYIGEIADPKIRGLLGSWVAVTWIFGILLINVIGSYLTIGMAALVSSIFPILTLITFFGMPESPYFLLMKDREKLARNSLQKLRGRHDVENELLRLSNSVKSVSKKTNKFWDLFLTKSIRKAVFVMMILRGSQQLTGTTAISFYTQNIFNEAGTTISPELASIIYFTVQLIMTLFCSSIVDKVGRRPLLILSLTGSTITIFLESLYFYIKNNTNIDTTSLSFIPVIALIGFVIIFSCGLQSIPILMLGELFPTNFKAFALCFADIYFCTLASIVSKFFQITRDKFGMYLPFMAFTIASLMLLIAVIFFVPETKGRTLEEIQQDLAGKKNNNDNCTDNIEI